MLTDTITLRELTIRYAAKLDPAGHPVPVGARLTTPQAAAAAFATILEDEVVEVFGMLCVSTKRDVIAYHEVSRGTLDCTTVQPREVFQAALLTNCSGLLVAHNHPSGDATPSPDDVQLTRRLADAGTLLGVELLDHVIIGAGRWFSFRQGGLL